MIHRLVLATANPGKAVEVRAALPGVEVQTLADHPSLSSPVEDGATYIDNARIKAEALCRALNIPALADDSGLSVDALNGAPGVLSARYAEGTDKDRNRKLLAEMADVADEARTARFVCAMAFIRPEEPAVFTEARCEGVIRRSPLGDGGFGYDPLFELPDGRSMAQLSTAQKNAISHRGLALRALLPILKLHFA
ncbi:MAG: RdgB/HAM1 family non-canonical purine NTP pyrophosphatase [Myxococcota bacterium]